MARRKKPRHVVEPTTGGYVLHLDAEEIDLVVRLLGELRSLLLSDDPAHHDLLRRLFPPAYHLADDAEAEAEYQRLMREDLVASRLEGIAMVETSRRISQRSPHISATPACAIPIGTSRPARS